MVPKNILNYFVRVNDENPGIISRFVEEARSVNKNSRDIRNLCERYPQLFNNKTLRFLVNLIPNKK
jgi:hypothetical protein